MNQAKEYKKKIGNARVLIDQIHFTNMPEYDLSVSDVNYIRSIHDDNSIDMVYAAYKLGFARGMKKKENDAV